MRVAEYVAPLATRSDLERALVRHGIFTFQDFQDTNYGWNKRDFITYTLLEQASSRVPVARYIGVLEEFLDDTERRALHEILEGEGVRLRVTIPAKPKAKAAEPPVKGRRKRRQAHSSEIFLAHSSANHLFVERLATDLRRRGVRVWFDQWEITVGDSIVQKVNKGLHSHSYLGIVLSPEAVRSPWVHKELDAGLIRELRTRRVVVLPILHKDCRIPPLLQGKHYADFRRGYHSGLDELLGVLRPRAR